MKELSVENQIYLCKYHDIVKSYELHATMGLKKDEVTTIIDKLKENGLYEQYRNLPDEEYEKIIKRENKKDKFEKILDKYRFDKQRSGYIDLTFAENKILKVLIDNKEGTIPNRKIKEKTFYSQCHIRNIINQLRRKLQGEVNIRTVRTIGYAIKN